MKLLFIILLTYSSFLFANDRELKICLTGSTEKALPKYGEAFVNGVKLALSENTNKRNNVVYEVHYYESNPLAPLEALNRMRKSSCDAIIGFSTGNDLISVEQDLKRNPIFTLSIYGDPQERFNHTNYLRTMQPSAEDLVKSLFQKLPEKISKKSKILIVTAVDRSEMVSYRDAYLNELKKKTSDITQINVLEQTHDLRQFEAILKNESKWDFVVILTRSFIAAEITDKLQINPTYTSPIILGTKYFGTSELPAYYNFLKNKKIKAYFPRQNCSCDRDTQYQDFKKKYIDKFSISPMSISSDSFDATNFIIQVLTANKLSSKSIISFLNSNKKEFKGITSFKVQERIKVSSDRRFLLRIDETGYGEIE